MKRSQSQYFRVSRGVFIPNGDGITRDIGGGSQNLYTDPSWVAA